VALHWHCNACHTSTTSWISLRMNHNASQGGGAGWCKACHATGTSYLGNMDKKALNHDRAGKTDCSESGCHCRWGSKGTPDTNGIESLMALRITPAFFDSRHLVVALAATSCTVHAQMVEELEFRKEAGNAVVQVRFGSAIQFQRSIASRSGDLFQVFYNVVSGNEYGLDA